MTTIVRADLNIAVEIVGQWINDDTRNYAALADALRQSELAEPVIGVIVLELMSAAKLKEWRTILSGLAGRAIADGNTVRPVENDVVASPGSGQDVWAVSFEKWESRYSALGDALAFGDTPTIDVRRAVQIYRHLHGDVGGMAIDLGAGDGRNTLFLATSGFEVLAVDAAPSGLRKLEQRADEYGVEIHVQEADLRTFDIPPDLDLLVASYVIHLLPAPLETLQNWASCLRPGGIIVVSSRGRQSFDPPEYWFPPVGALHGFFDMIGWNILATREEQELRPSMNAMFRHTAVVAQNTKG